MRDVGEALYGVESPWQYSLAKVLGLTSTQMSVWADQGRAPDDFEERLIAAVCRVRSEEAEAAARRHVQLCGVERWLDANRLPEEVVLPKFDALPDELLAP